jgi:hypothetical protein
LVPCLPGKLFNAPKRAFFLWQSSSSDNGRASRTSTRRNRTTERKLKVQIHGCVQGNEAEINQAVENALSNLMALAERGDIEFDGPEDMAHVAEQMIRASMDRMGIEDVVRLSVTCVGVE